jgi:hypothetical protein
MDYENKGIELYVFWDTFADLIVKMEECYKIKGVYAIFVETWFAPFFQLKAFKIGRFQYRIRDYKYSEPYCINGVPFIRKGVI